MCVCVCVCVCVHTHKSHQHNTCSCFRLFFLLSNSLAITHTLHNTHTHAHTHTHTHTHTTNTTPAVVSVSFSYCLTASPSPTFSPQGKHHQPSLRQKHRFPAYLEYRTRYLQDEVPISHLFPASWMGWSRPLLLLHFLHGSCTCVSTSHYGASSADDMPYRCVDKAMRLQCGSVVSLSLLFLLWPK